MQTLVVFFSGCQSKLFCIILHFLLLSNPAMLCRRTGLDTKTVEEHDIFREKKNLMLRIKHKEPFPPIPENFDAREVWPLCESIKFIAQQGICGNCWAHAITGMVSDRTCIASNQTLQRQFSTEDLFTCCKDCTFDENKCGSGSLALGILYYITEGLVSGANPGSDKGCKPLNEISVKSDKFTPCLEECTNKKYNTTYKQDKMKGEKLVYMDSRQSKGKGWNSTQLQVEIIKNGPVTGSLLITTELEQKYKSGVFEKDVAVGEQADPHAIRIIGWGVENTKPYWLIANSWGEEYGEKGCVKLLRGSNTLNIENVAYAGIVGDIDAITPPPPPPPPIPTTTPNILSSAKRFHNLSAQELLINLFIVVILRFFS